MNVLKSGLELYWEDATKERLIYLELDARSWELAEKIFKYKKKYALYIYQNETSSAFFLKSDSEKEAELGFKFYSVKKNADQVISIKKKIFKDVGHFWEQYRHEIITNLTDKKLQEMISESLNLYHKALCAHVLTQPQFFEEFEKKSVLNSRILRRLAEARYKYTRTAWTSIMSYCRSLFKEYALRHSISLQEAESLRVEEFHNNKIDKRVLATRSTVIFIKMAKKVVLYTGGRAEEIIKSIKKNISANEAKGVPGNQGTVRGRAFVVQTEMLDLHNPPRGMRKLDILVVPNAWPELSKYYTKASAIVTNEGGITSHGVVIARELGIPCLVGTRIATKIFRTGDIIEVSADLGLVRKI